MTITIDGVDYAFHINGTVGLVYLAQRILGNPDKDGEQFDGNNTYHQIVLYYAAFHQSNKDKKNLPDLQDFISSLTTKTMKEMTAYFWARWNELEGITTGDKPSEDKEAAKGEE